MVLLKKNKKKDADGRESEPEVDEKEVNMMSTYPDEKIAADTAAKSQDEKITVSNDGIVSSPSPEATLLPAYRPEASPTIGQQLSTSSTALLSTKSSSEVASAIHPVTSQALMPDDGKEVVLPDKTTHTPSLPTSVQATRSYREYNFYYTNALTHLIICDPDQQVLFFAEMSPYAKGMPDVQFRDIAGAGFDNLARIGPNLRLREAKDAPIVAIADAMPSSKHIKLGLGDPLQPETNTWIVMRNVHDDPKNNSERYDMTVNRASKQMTYQWISGAAGDKDPADPPDMGKTRRSSHSKEVFRLLSDEGLVASFRNASMASVKKRGTLRVYEEAGIEDLLLLVFLSCSALCEKQRRRKVKKSLLMGASSMWSKEK